MLAERPQGFLDRDLFRELAGLAEALVDLGELPIEVKFADLAEFRKLLQDRDHSALSISAGQRERAEPGGELERIGLALHSLEVAVDGKEVDIFSIKRVKRLSNSVNLELREVDIFLVEENEEGLARDLSELLLEDSVPEGDVPDRFRDRFRVAEEVLHDVLDDLLFVAEERLVLVVPVEVGLELFPELGGRLSLGNVQVSEVAADFGDLFAVPLLNEEYGGFLLRLLRRVLEKL